MLDLGFKLSIMPVVPVSCCKLALLASVSDELLAMVSLSWLPSTPLCVSSDVSWKWAFKRKRLKNFSVSSFTWNSSGTDVVGIKLTPLANRDLSCSSS